MKERRGHRKVAARALLLDTATEQVSTITMFEQHVGKLKEGMEGAELKRMLLLAPPPNRNAFESVRECRAQVRGEIIVDESERIERKEEERQTNIRFFVELGVKSTNAYESVRERRTPVRDEIIVNQS